MTKEHKTTDYANSRFTQKPPTEWLKGRLKHPTGFCNPYQPVKAQSHEGDNVPKKVCEFYETCPCYCHYQIDQMFEMVGLPRPEPEQSAEYSAMIADVHLQTQQMLDSLALVSRFSGPLSSPSGPVAPPDHKGPYTGQVDGVSDMSAARIQPVFAPTPTGRRARGQLEHDVLAICLEFMGEVYDWEHCLPKLVSEAIGDKYAIEPPSTGAVNAVWDRWEKLGIAEQAKKPSRLVRFLHDDLNPVKLEAIKAKAKSEKKRGVAEQRRGTIRGQRPRA